MRVFCLTIRNGERTQHMYLTVMPSISILMVFSACSSFSLSTSIVEPPYDTHKNMTINAVSENLLARQESLRWEMVVLKVH